MSAERPEADRRPLNPELKAVEALLATLRPAAVGIDRDRVMYEAGAAAARQASRRRGLALHRIAIGCAVAASLVCGIWIGNQTARDTLQQAVRIDQFQANEKPPVVAASPRDTASPKQLPPDSYAELRRHIAAADVDFPRRISSSEEVVPEAAADRSSRAELLQLLN